MAPRLVIGTLYTSPDLHFEVEHRATSWIATDRDGRSVTLEYAADPSTRLTIEGQPSARFTPHAMLDAKLADRGEGILGLAPDPSEHDLVLNPAVGYVHGVGGAYVGTAGSPQGPGSPVWVFVMSARQGSVTAVITLVTHEAPGKAQDKILARTDSVLNTFRFSPGPA